jgi:UPF0755 protein
MPNILRKRFAIIFVGLLSLLMAFIIAIFGLFFIKPYEKDGAEQLIVVQEGLALRDVAEELKSKAIISNKELFMVWARVMGYSRNIKAGEYRLSSQMAPIRIFEILTRGVIITYPVTIPEGFSSKQIAELLDEKDLIEKDMLLSLLHNQEILRKYGISTPSLEGFLYPDTYQFAKGLAPKTIVDTMVNRFNEMIEPLKEKIIESGMTLDEIVTLASIVEKETGKADERPIIASVFLNRINKKMRLESDPTVIYGIKEFSGNITKKHLSEKTPYNTYVIRGLPPGPIANPGIEAIKAVLYPSETDYLYFVSKNDGSHYFSKSLKEHNNAVIKYQKNRRSQ